MANKSNKTNRYVIFFTDDEMQNLELKAKTIDLKKTDIIYSRISDFTSNEGKNHWLNKGEEFFNLKRLSILGNFDLLDYGTVDNFDCYILASTKGQVNDMYFIAKDDDFQTVEEIRDGIFEITPINWNYKNKIIVDITEIFPVYEQKQNRLIGYAFYFDTKRPTKDNHFLSSGFMAEFNNVLNGFDDFYELDYLFDKHLLYTKILQNDDTDYDIDYESADKIKPN